MIRKSAGIAFLGGAALALLSGCVEVPATYQPVPVLLPPPSGVGMRAYLEQRRAYIIEQQNAFRQFRVEPDNRPVTQAPPLAVEPDIAPVTEAPPPPPKRVPRTPVDDRVISENSPATPAPVPKAPVAKAPADADCVGWWRICHFL